MNDNNEHNLKSGFNGSISDLEHIEAERKLKFFSLSTFKNELIKAVASGEEYGTGLMLRNLLQYESIREHFKARGFDPIRLNELLRINEVQDNYRRQRAKEHVKNREHDDDEYDDSSPEDILHERSEKIKRDVYELGLELHAAGKAKYNALSVLKSILTGGYHPQSDCGLKAFSILGITPARLFPELDREPVPGSNNHRTLRKNEFDSRIAEELERQSGIMPDNGLGEKDWRSRRNQGGSDRNNSRN